MSDNLHYVLSYEFGELKPGSPPFRDYLNAVLEDYLERVRAMRMSLIGLPPDTRNWEQIEAHEKAASFSSAMVDTLDDGPDSGLLLRTVLVAGRERETMQVVDLVRA